MANCLQGLVSLARIRLHGMSTKLFELAELFPPTALTACSAFAACSLN